MIPVMIFMCHPVDRPQVDGPVVKSLRVAVRGADDEGQDDWISPALPPLAMIKQARRGFCFEACG